jgi:hypothetical protein
MVMPASTSAELTTAQRAQVRLAAQFPARLKSIQEVVQRCGPLRTLGGVDAYLAIRARLPSATVDEVAAAFESRQIFVGPAVRGCMYIAAAADQPWLLGIAGLLARPRLLRDLEKVKVDDPEVRRLGEQIVRHLERHGPTSTDALRNALPSGAVRSLGPLGKKVGLASTLPPTLRLLELDGRIARQPEAMRVDQERYIWSVAPNNSPPARPALVQSLVEHYFLWSGLATFSALVEWSGLTKRDLQPAFDALSLGEWTCDGQQLHGFPKQVASALAAKPNEALALLGFEDNLVAFASGMSDWYRAEHHALPLPNWGRSGTVQLGASRFSQLRAIVAEGRLVGFWEFNPAAQAIEVMLLDPIAEQTNKRLQKLVKSTTAFLVDSFGHARSFNLDTDAQLVQRCKQLEEIRALREGT